MHAMLAQSRRWASGVIGDGANRLFFLPPLLHVAPASYFKAGGAGLKRPPSAAGHRRALEVSPSPVPWLTSSTGGNTSASVLRTASRGLARLTRSLASEALDKESSLASGRLTPSKSVMQELREGGQRSQAQDQRAQQRQERQATSRQLAPRLAALVEEAAARGIRVQQRQAPSQSSQASYLGAESQARIQGTFSTFSAKAREGVAAVLADKDARQEGKTDGLSPRQRLVLLVEEAKARGLRVAGGEANKDLLRQGHMQLKAEGYFREGSSPLPYQRAQAKPPSSPLVSPVGRLVDFMGRNKEQLLAEARAIAWGEFRHQGLVDRGRKANS